MSKTIGLDAPTRTSHADLVDSHAIGGAGDSGWHTGHDDNLLADGGATDIKQGLVYLHDHVISVRNLRNKEGLYPPN